MAKTSTLKGSTVSAIAPIQEQAISTKYIEKHVFNVKDDDKYLEGHDNICKYIHVFLLLEHGFIENYIPWYQHEPKQVAENNPTKIMWNFSIQTDHELTNNKPDINLVHKINKTANLTEVAFPNDYNICNKRLQKIESYTNLSGEIKTFWNLNKVQINPVIVSALGMFYKKIDDDISELGLMNLKFRVKEAQNIALLGTAHIVWNFLQIVYYLLMTKPQ